MTWIQTRTGLALDLVDPKPEMIDITGDAAPALSLISRFGGHAGDGRNVFSVAQHSILGARALMAETDASDIALAFLLHDAHEFAMGDFTTPVVQALNRLAWPRDSEAVSNALQALKLRLDAAIHARLGLDWPLPDRVAAHVKDMDIRMLRAERDALLGRPPRPWHRSVEAAEPIDALGWRDFLPMRPEAAAGEWLALLAEWLPHPVKGVTP